ncbi:VpsF family polysaccharide biosynthesis protein [Mesorhizobium sp. C089B]|uniref:VpsF family polysaccharide biosynthesis protein n=1 Tax=Mesorhizobium sp. C089B TaxID=2956823 RepID=UPI002575305C|nr:VpsF family polysaccharide biosynthesis protein [Mesorhizobium sp. C089B]WJI54006.1 VpsF family polysaccharide biosynthesis protein [Mesorhizobium sp. C089B]
MSGFSAKLTCGGPCPASPLLRSGYPYSFTFVQENVPGGAFVPCHLNRKPQRWSDNRECHPHRATVRDRAGQPPRRPHTPVLSPRGLRFPAPLDHLSAVDEYGDVLFDGGGSFPEKLHIGTYAIFLLLVVIATTRPIRLEGDEVRLFKATLLYSLLLLWLVPYLFVIGRAGSAGFIIDSYLVSCAAAMIMLALGDHVRRALGNVIVGMIVLSAIIGTIEAVTQHRFLPYPLVELDFRPIGLSAHPLALGALCTTAIGFVALTRWRIWVCALCIFILFIGTAASGARTALLLACGEILFLLVFLPWPDLSPRHQRQAKLLVLMLTLAGGAILIAILFSAGLLNRFSNTLFDQNYDARVKIYDVFKFVEWRDILLGMNPNELLKIVNEKLNLPFIESTPVVLTLLFGLPIALLFAFAFFRFLFKLLRNTPRAAHIAAAASILAALSNNALSSKAPDIMLLVILLLAYRKPDGRQTGTPLQGQPASTAT